MVYDMEQYKQDIADSVLNTIASMQEEGLDQQNNDLLGSNENVKLINTLLDDGWQETIHKKGIIQKFFAINSKAAKLSNLENNEELVDFMNMFDVSKISFIQSMPQESFTFENMFDIDQMELNFDLSLRRSKGIPQGKINERGLIGMQIQQKISSHTEGSRSSGGYGGGWFDKVKGWFG